MLFVEHEYQERAEENLKLLSCNIYFNLAVMLWGLVAYYYLDLHEN
jgi:hypothetical protein